MCLNSVRSPGKYWKVKKCIQRWKSTSTAQTRSARMAFTSEPNNKRLVGNAVVQRFYAHAISGEQEQALVFVPQGKTKHAL